MWWLIIVLLLAPAAAHAEPVSLAFSAVVSSISAAAAEFTLSGFIAKIVISRALSVLARALSSKPKRKSSGITTKYTTTGETNYETFIFGKYATAGQLVYPPLTHGGTSGAEYKTLVLAVSCLPVTGLSRIAIGGQWVEITATVDPNYGNALGGSFAGYAWVKFYDGTQTAADAMLVAKYSGHATYPWTGDMAGLGIAYAIVTLRANATLFPSQPGIRFEIDGLKLYDPRLDTTAGGSGAQRWADTSTWAATTNPAVMIYNVMRGVDVEVGDIYGAQVVEADMPYATWATAMDECDGLVTDPVTMLQFKRYECGYEITLNTSPRDIVNELLIACSGAMADVGGRWLIRVGAPAVASIMLIDDDVVVTDNRSLRPIASRSDTHNSVAATWVDPDAVYTSKDATTFVDQVGKQEDGQKLVADIDLPAVLSEQQVIRLQQNWLADDRRWRTHEMTLPARMVGVEPFDVVAFTSTGNSYSARPFEVANVHDSPLRMTQRVTLREIDYNDWT